MAHRPLYSLPVGLLGRSAGHPPIAWNLAAWLADNLLAERERWLLWLPVGLGTGIAGYFALPVEPPVWPGALGLLLASVALAWLWRRHPNDVCHGCVPGLLGCLVLLLGFCAVPYSG